MRSIRSQIAIILWKEFHEQCNAKILIPMVAVPSLFPLLSFALGVLFFIRNDATLAVEHMRVGMFTIFAFGSYVLVSTVFLNTTFYRERQARTLETLLATPLSPVGIWLGKTVFLFFLGYSVANFITWGALVLVNILRPPGVPVFLPRVEALVVFLGPLPALGFSVTALTGFAYLKTSNALLSNLIGLGLTALSYGSTYLTSTIPVFGWYSIGFVTVVSLVLLGLVWVASKHLTCEDIVSFSG